MGLPWATVFHCFLGCIKALFKLPHMPWDWRGLLREDIGVYSFLDMS